MVNCKQSLLINTDLMKNLFLCFVLLVGFSTQAATNIPFQTVRLVYTGQVTTSAWTQLTAGITLPISRGFIFDSSGQTLMLGTGPAGSEVNMPLIVVPGGNGDVPLNISPNTRVSIKALSGPAASGEIDINFFL